MSEKIEEALADHQISQQKFTGGCLCGAVRYECSAPPKFAYYCHCTDCQKGSGSAFHIGLSTAAASVKIIAGEPKSYTKKADSGNLVTRTFCMECGSPLYVGTDASPDFLSIKAGSLDDPSWVKPTIEIWTDSEIPCARIGKIAKRFPKSPRKSSTAQS